MTGEAQTPFRQRVARALRDTFGVENGPVAVAVSGGVDSTVLLRTLHQLDIDCVALHVDHGLRDDAASDVAFVSELAKGLGIPHECLRVTVAEGNRQHEARTARYGALTDAARRHRCTFLATGHTATDQAETVLMHLVRGTGLRGLAGMDARRPLGKGVELVRPLLRATREEVEAEANQQGWTWREDPSNATDSYRRNRIRHQVLPLLESEGGPGTVRRIAAAADAARAALPDLDAFTLGTDRVLNLDALRTVPDRSALWIEALAAWAPHVRRTQDLVRQLDGLVEKSAGRYVPVGSLVAWRDRDAIRLVEPAAPIETTLRVGETLETDWGTLELAEMDSRELYTQSQPEPSAVLELLKPEALEGELVVRTWRAGDRLVPTGMDGTKRVSDLLTERRVRPSERERQLVLCAGRGIAWVVGHRVAAWAGHRDSSMQFVRAVWTPRLSVG